ncbi:MAG: hypothetical protein WC091_08635 [Sulfuricellaceae bacterium]
MFASIWLYGRCPKRLWIGRTDSNIACTAEKPASASFGCDNETGKGDHRHYGECEEAYIFVSLPQLIDDFKQDCARLAGWRWET